MSSQFSLLPSLPLFPLDGNKNLGTVGRCLNLVSQFLRPSPPLPLATRWIQLLSSLISEVTAHCFRSRGLWNLKHHSRVGRWGGARGKLGRKGFNLKGMSEGQGHRLLLHREHHDANAYFLFQENPESLASCKYWDVKYWVLCRWSNLFQIFTLFPYCALCSVGFILPSPLAWPHMPCSGRWSANSIDVPCFPLLQICIKRKEFLFFIFGNKMLRGLTNVLLSKL